MKVLSLNVSDRKGPKSPVGEIELRVDHGVVGDFHSGPGIKQVSLLAKESHDAFQPMTKVCLKSGIFGENITTQGIDLKSLRVGDSLGIGGCVLEVSQIGKECHAPCAIARNVGECIMPKECVFAVVRKPGCVSEGDKITILKN